MTTRVSHKVESLKRRLLEVMLRQREHERNDHYYSVAAWVAFINAEKTRLGENDPVTDPQIRRCLVSLAVDQKIQVSGHGHKSYRAITLAQKLEQRESEQRAHVKEQLLLRIRGLGLAASERWDGMIISWEASFALAEMLEDFPGIAEQYFAREVGDVEQQ
jgi:hypothetical protein